MTLPILYSFRRCPYAMRGRMGLAYAGITCEIREIVFRDKPKHMLEISPKGTVPVLLLPDGTVLEESLDVLDWALSQNDPDGWNDLDEEELELTNHLISENDGAFKRALDRYKYPSRYEDEFEGDEKAFAMENRDKVEAHLSYLNDLLKDRDFLVKPSLSKADIALFPFLRQFSKVETEWFDSLPFERLQAWLDIRLNDPMFERIMHKYPVWDGKSKELFPSNT